MKKKPFSLKTKVGVCVLMFSFLLFPITPNIALAADDAVTENIAGAKVAQAEAGTGAGAGEAAAGAAATGASTGLSGAAIAAIAVGVAAATVAIIAVSTGGDDAAAPTTHHP